MNSRFSIADENKKLPFNNRSAIPCDLFSFSTRSSISILQNSYRITWIVPTPIGQPNTVSALNRNVNLRSHTSLEKF